MIWLKKSLLGLSAVLFWVMFSQQLTAQDATENGYIVSYLEENLSAEGRIVRFADVTGILSSQASIGEITIADSQGVWLRIKGAKIDWTRSALLTGAVSVNALSADSVTILRQPIPAPSSLTPEAVPWSLPELPVSVKIDTIKIARLVIEKPVMGVPATLMASAALQLDTDGIQVSLDAKRLVGGEGALHLALSQTRATRLLDIDLKISEPEQGLVVTALDIAGKPPLSVSLQGKGSLDDVAIALDVSTSTPKIIKGLITLKTTEIGQTVSGSFDGDISALVAPNYRDFFAGTSALTLFAIAQPEGGFAIPELRLKTGGFDLRADMATEADGFISTLNLQARLASGNLDRLVLPFGSGAYSVENAEARIDFDKSRDQNWSASFVVQGVETPDMSGRSVTLKANGNSMDLADPVKRSLAGLADIALVGLTARADSWASVLAPSLTASLDWSWAAGQPLRLASLDVSGADFALEGSGSLVGSRFSGNLLGRMLDLGRLAGVMPEYRPAGAASFTYSGWADFFSGQFDGNLSFEGQDVATGLDRLDRLLKGTSSFHAGLRRDELGFGVKGLALASPAIQIDLSGQISRAARHATLEARFNDLSDMSAHLTGRGKLKADLTGTAEDPMLAAEFSVANGLQISLSGAVGEDLNLVAKFADLPLGLVNEVQPDPGLSGMLTGQARIQGTVSHPALQFDLIGQQVKSGIAALKDLGAANLTAKGAYQTDSLTLDAFTADTGTGLGLVGSGRIDIAARSLRVKVSGHAPLGLANPFLATSQVVVSGAARFDLDLSGGLTSPDIHGSAELSDTKVSIPSANVNLTGARAQLQFSDQTATITQASASFVGGGQITASGSIGLTSAMPVDIRVGLERIRYSDEDLVTSTLSGDVTLQGAVASTLVIGGTVRPEIVEITLKSAVAAAHDLVSVTHKNPPQSVRQTLHNAGLDRLKTAGSTDSALALALTIDAPNRIFVRGRGLDAEVGGSVILSGKLSEIAATGKFTLLRGRLQFLGQRLNLTKGTLGFTGSLDPFIDFTAETTRNGINAALRLTGKASEPELILSSDPNLPQDEILARMIFNRNLSDISVLQITQLAAAVAELSGLTGTGLIEKLRRAAGVDNLDIRTSDTGEVTGAVGKYLNDKLYSEVEIGASGQAGASINLDLGKNLSLKAKVGDTGAGGLGLTFEKEY